MQSSRRVGKALACPPFTIAVLMTVGTAQGRLCLPYGSAAHPDSIFKQRTHQNLPRREAPEAMRLVSHPSKSEGAGNAGRPWHPRSVCKNCTRWTTGTRHARRSLRDGFTAYG